MPGLSLPLSFMGFVLMLHLSLYLPDKLECVQTAPVGLTLDSLKLANIRRLG
jgi:hypothetical protein